MVDSINIATALQMQREELAQSMHSAGRLPANAAIIDVRDDDHIGGHIKGSTHVPSSQLDWKLPELVRTLSNKDTVIFHCALSQQRGPKAAMRYLQERNRMLGIVPATNRHDPGQKVFVLQGGFVQWQAKYGGDEALTDAYVADIWQEY